ncbi:MULTISPECIES: sigma factor-like helix-turn-helix DNA-binding protein [Streptomyces]|uniref:Sigma factor-like helix-turn-helix DNA-binding protein n=1 Tax=Streptomyces griseosporeus TaxID=1910 RepID=A0ABV3KZ04_STRGS|nr:sigma factor-like helix-turn-helix DNA-binding protein [Streptomyces actuosus]
MNVGTSWAELGLAERPQPYRAVAPFRSAEPQIPEDAFDALYADTAGSLVHQAYLLTGHRRLAFESVEWAFHRAWERWPEVAADPDPAAWVRAQVYDHALAPWHRFRPGIRRADPSAVDAVHRALLELPPQRRRAVLLCDGLGLGLFQAAAEMEATPSAARSRLLHARAHLGRRVPDAEGPTARHLDALVRHVSTATLPRAGSVRRAGEQRIRALTTAAFTATAGLACLVTLVTAAASWR